MSLILYVEKRFHLKHHRGKVAEVAGSDFLEH